MKLSHQVEPLQIRDWYGARRVTLDCFPSVSAYSLRQGLCRDRAHSGVVRIEDQVVGVINLMLPDASNAHWLDVGTQWVQSVAVSSSFRGLGIGRALMEWAHEHALRHDMAAVSLAVQRTNVAAIELYGRLGYRNNAGEGEKLGMTLALPDAPPRPVAAVPAQGWLPERVRLLPEHVAYRFMAEFQDHIAPWFSLDPLVSTIDRR
jgi:GNAT superfamily N-acetyltransferase